MNLANPLWGAPRIHGELLKLGINVGQTSVAKYMARHRSLQLGMGAKLNRRGFSLLVYGDIFTRRLS